MNSNRLEQLFQFYKEDPDDPFNLYALATEYKSEDPQKALVFFEKLVSEHPDYTPTYYHLAQLYIDFGLEEKAKSIYEMGIELTEKSREHLLLRELRNAYNELMTDM